jgi:hypothetical protein
VIKKDCFEFCCGKPKRTIDDRTLDFQVGWGHLYGYAVYVYDRHFPDVLETEIGEDE